MNDFKVGDLVVVSPNATRWCSLKPHLGIVVKPRRGVAVETYVVVLQDGRKRLVRPSQLQKLSESYLKFWNEAEKNYLTNQKNPDTI